MKQTQINAEIVAHSINEQGDELISVLATFPRIILAEVNTHRMLSKNTSSSRAIPFAKMVETIQNDPFIPIAWQKDHKGMQGTEYITDKTEIEACINEWLFAKEQAIFSAEILTERSKVTKQLCNRLLEPFMWTTMLITGPKSGWDNFFKLRCPSYMFHDGDLEEDKEYSFRSKKDAINHFPSSMDVEYETGNKFLKDLTELDWLKLNTGQAEIHMMALAECIWDAYNESTPKVLKAGEWHTPFVNVIVKDEIRDTTRFDHLSSEEIVNRRVKISVAMAARTSYTVVGEEKGIDYEAMIGLHDRLLAQDPPHSSPMEHCSVCVSQEEYDISFKGQEKGWFRNYKGFKSYRQIIEESK